MSNEQKLRFLDRIKILRTGQIDEKSLFSGRRQSIIYSGLMPFMSIDPNEQAYITEGYEKNDDLYSVIDYIVTLAAGLDFYFEETLADGTTEEVELPDLEKLLKRPQPGVNYRQFIKQAIGFRLLTGDGFVYGPKLENGVNRGKTQLLMVLPSQYMKVEKADNELTSNAKKYTFQFAGKSYDIPDTDIGHFMAATYDWTDDGRTRGMSPLKAGLMRLSSSNDALRNKAARFQNSGADGIVGTKNNDAGEEEARAMEHAYERKYGGPDNAGRMVWTNLDVTYKRFGLSPVDLQILQSMSMDLQAFARMYRLDAKLVDPNAPTTYNNVREAKAAAYTMAVLPTVQEFFDMLNEWLVPAYSGGKNIRIKADTSKIVELQKDLESLSKSLSAVRWAISINEARNYLDLPEYDDPDADIPEGMKMDPGFNMNPQAPQ